MPFCTLLSAKESRPYDLLKFSQCPHPAFIGAEVLLGAIRHLLKFGVAQTVQQLQKIWKMLSDLLAQLLIVV
jgi:hypothetical protein